MRNRQFSSKMLRQQQQQQTQQAVLNSAYIPARDGTRPSILWSAILRDDIMLVEADLGAAVLYEVQEAAQQLLKKPPTPGWEHSTLNRHRVSNAAAGIGIGNSYRGSAGTTSSIASTSSSTDKLKGMKFHVYEHYNTDGIDEDEELRYQRYLLEQQQQNYGQDVDSMDEQQQQLLQQTSSYIKSKASGLTIWTFACVYDPSLLDMIQVQSFLEKIVTMTEIFRQPPIVAADEPKMPMQSDEYSNPFSSSYHQQSTKQEQTEDLWRYGKQHALQDTFAPILLQRMEEVSYMGKMAMCHERVDAVKAIMARNIELILENEEKLAIMANEKSKQLNEMAKVFAKRSKQVKRQMLWNNAKHGAIIGTAITAGVAIAVVPPLIAIL